MRNVGVFVIRITKKETGPLPFQGLVPIRDVANRLPQKSLIPAARKTAG